MEQLLNWLPDSPIVAFTVLLLVSLTIPPVFERLRLPGLVGLLVAGIILGQNGLGLLDAKSETMKLLSDIGKVYLMFVAGLEIDLEDFRKKKDRSLGFGLATFLLPLAMGTAVGQLFGMGLNASILLGSLLASHTLLGYPIVNRLGVVRNEAVTVTIGATIFTDIAALLVLAVCVSIHAGEFSPVSLVMQLGALALYAAAVLFGFDWAGKAYFRRTGDEDSNQFLFVLLAVFLAAVGAQIINVDMIVGAFLAGLAVNDVVGHSPVEEKVEFVGSTLFIPFFFVDMGLLLDVPGFVTTLISEFWLTLAIVVGLIGSKFLAAVIAKWLYRYHWQETLTMWSLSLPQVAATLAAALAGVNAGIITESVFNTVIVLMLVTAILGPVLTARFASKLSLQEPSLDGIATFQPADLVAEHSQDASPFTVVVPIANPTTERYLIEMGALLAKHESGVVVPLAIAKSHVHMDEPELKIALQQNQQLLKRAVAVTQEFQVQAQPITRIDDDVAYGISRTAREQNAHLIVMGWSSTSRIQTRLFGNVTDSVFWSAHCPVAVMRLLEEPIAIHRILVPVRDLSWPTLRSIRFAQLFAETNQAQVTLLHVCDRRTAREATDWFEAELNAVLAKIQPQIPMTIQTLRHDDVSQGIIRTARHFDLVVLRSIRRRTAGGLAVSDVTTQVITALRCSVVLFGEPSRDYPH